LFCREAAVCSIKYGNEVDFEGLDCCFSVIESMVSWGCYLIVQSISFVKSYDVSLSNQCCTGLMPAFCRSSYSSSYPLINDSYFLFFIATALIVFESKSYMTSTYAFPCPDVVENFPGKSVAIIPFNRIPAMAVYIRPLFGVLFLQGHISLKNRTYCPVLKASTSPFKSRCHLIYLTGFRLLPQYWGRILGSFFYGGVSPSKIGPIAPY
jgi:hypothetical protein